MSKEAYVYVVGETYSKRVLSACQKSIYVLIKRSEVYAESTHSKRDLSKKRSIKKETYLPVEKTLT